MEKRWCRSAIAFLFSGYLRMHFEAHLRSARMVLETYHGEMPFAAWLKNFFRQHKKYGSRDRRLIADLCFCFYRLGNAFSQFSLEERLLIGQFLCHHDSPFVAELKPTWQDKMRLPVTEKIAFHGQEFCPFPFVEELSSAIEKEAFQLSFLQQPDLFLRIRPRKEREVTRKLSAAGISFQQEGSCLRLPNNTNVDEIIRIDDEAVVQDISSQQVIEPLQQHLTPNFQRQTSFWDCCAASGGKTILLHDLLPTAKISVSDIRESILVNLKNRLKRAGIRPFQTFVADVGNPHFSLPQKFDIIICDAPCSGSGTWGRTPEQLVFFRQEKIDHYTSLQKSIALNASRSVKKGGFFLYVTCSVFSRENEAVVDHILQHSELSLLSQQYFKGYHKRGDTLFAALFTT